MFYNYHLIVVNRSGSFGIDHKQPSAVLTVGHNNAVGLCTGNYRITPKIGYNALESISAPVVGCGDSFVSFIRWQYKQTFVCVLLIISVGICPQIAEFVNIKIINYTCPLIAKRKTGRVKIIFMYLFIVLDMIYALVKGTYIICIRILRIFLYLEYIVNGIRRLQSSFYGCLHIPHHNR